LEDNAIQLLGFRYPTTTSSFHFYFFFPHIDEQMHLSYIQLYIFWPAFY